MATIEKKKTDTSAIRAEWLHDVNDVIDQIALWMTTHPMSPAVRRMVATISEPELGTYEVPVLDVVFNDKFRDAVTVEPIGRNYPGRGAIEITSWPSLRRVNLLRDPLKSWIVYTRSKIPLHEDWNEVNFRRLIDDLRAEL